METQKWDKLEAGIRAWIGRYKALEARHEEASKRLSSLEAELEAVHALRTERDKLKSERDMVKRRVLEMLQQLEKVAL